MTLSSRQLAGIAIAIVLIAVALLGVSYQAKHLSSRGTALQQVSEQFSPSAKPLGNIVIISYKEYRANAVRWSFAYFGGLFGSAFLSAAAALILKLEALSAKPKLRNDLAASLATLAALLVTLSATGNFQRKWEANRIAAGAMENLAYELLRPSAAESPDMILTKIQAINDARDADVVGVGSGTSAKPESGPALPSEAAE